MANAFFKFGPTPASFSFIFVFSNNFSYQQNSNSDCRSRPLDHHHGPILANALDRTTSKSNTIDLSLQTSFPCWLKQDKATRSQFLDPCLRKKSFVPTNYLKKGQKGSKFLFKGQTGWSPGAVNFVRMFENTIKQNLFEL